MDLANGFLFPDQIDPEVPASWLPSTPAKQPSMPGMIPIALDYNPVVSQPASSNVHENTTLHGSQIRHVDTLFTGRSWKNGSSHPMGIATLEERLHYFSNYQAVMASEEPTPSRNLKPKWLATGNKTDVWTQVPLGKNSTRSYSPFMSSGFVGANQLQSPCPNQTLLNGKSPFYHSTFPRGNQSSQVSQVADQMIYANGASNVSRPNYNVSYTPQGVKMTYGNETKSVPVDPLTPDKFNRSQDVNYIENTLLENICLLGGENRSFMSNTYSNVREPIDMHSNQSILHPPIYGEFSFLLENEQRNAQGNLANPNIPVSACLAPVTPYKHNPMQDGQYGDQLMHLIDDDQLHTYHQYVTDANHTEKENAQIYPNQNKSGKEDIKSLQQAENQEELNGENHVIDLNKTPQQKPRRKKHRPKVIVEGKPSKKQRQPKKEGVTEGDNKSGKRKYLRKNGRIKDTPSINIAKTGEADDRTVKKPVKRALHFDSEVPVIKNIQPSTSGSECDKEFQGKNKDKLSQNDVLDRNKLSVSCELEQVENSSRVLFDLNNPINKLTGEFIQPDVSLQRTDLLREDRNCLAWERNGLEITNTSSGLGLFQSVINSTSLSNGSLCYSMADGVIGSRKWDYNVSSSSVGHLCDNVVARNVSTIGRDYSMRSPCAYHHGDGNHDNHLTVADKKLRLDDGKFKLLSYGSHTFPEGREALNLPCKQALTQSQTLVSLGKLQHAEQIQAYAGIQRKRKKLTESYPCNQLELTETNPCCQISAFTEGIVEGNPAVVTSTRLINKHQIHGVSCTLLNPELKCQQECEVSGFSSAHKSLNLVVFQHETLKGRSSQKFQNKQIKSRRRSSCQDMQSSSSFKHISPDVDPIDAIVEKLNFLMISEVPGYNSIQDSRQENAIVPYVADGTIILAEGSPGYSRRRSARAKVNLDSETNRVWLLLMGKDGNNNAEASDKDREKWWEEERRVFRGRVDSFIARMHLVQGDRRFSRWKGSVVDSVVGVFLTQNVSDHLSSSAFMSLAARFPFRSMEENRESRDAKASIPTEKINMPVTENDHKIQLPGFVPIHHCLNQISNVSSERQDTRRKDIEEGESLGEVTEENVFGYLRSRDIDAASTVNSMVNPLLLAKSMDSPQIYDIKSLEHGVSSQSSAMSSHNSSDSQAQIVGVRSNSKSNSYIEGITDENKWNCFDASIPFMDLLQMAGTDAFQDLYPCKSTVSNDLDFESVVPETSMAKCECIDKPHDACPSKQSRESQEGCGFEIETSHPSITPYSNLGIKMVADDLKNTEQLLSSMQSQIANTTCTKSSSTTCLLVKNSTEVTTHDKLFTCHAPYLVESHRDANSHVAQLSCMRETFSEEHLHHAYVPTELAISSHDTNNRHNPALSDREMAKCKQHESETCFLDNTLAVNEVITKTSKGAPSQLLTESTNGEIILDSKSSYTKDKHEDHNSSIGSLSSPSVLKREKDAVKQMKKKTMREQKVDFDWDSLRREACKYDQEKERNSGNMDSVDWEAVRCADVKQISDAIRERGMNNMLAERIKAFLDRLVREHGSIDLEWLRDIPPDKAKDYLLNIRGLGLKSVECVRLLTLHHLAFPVDTNVGRICVRLGWVPLQPLPEQLQLHLLELYPMLETIQKYLWPRLCKLDQRMLYELHYQMITFGKVFCTKSKPNCNSCPMRGECKHFASAFASARLALPGLEEKCLVTSRIPNSNETRHNTAAYPISLLQLEANSAFKPSTKNVEPIIEEPATPEPESLEYLESAIEDAFYEDSDEIPTIRLNIEQFTQNLHEIMQEKHMDVHEDEMSKSLVALTPESASLPQPKLKSISRLRTEHQVYELPDSHRLLERLNHRETDDPSPYLLAIWTPGETAQSTEPPDISCTSQDKGELCERKTCFSCNSVREAHDQKVRGTLLIPCRTAMRGSFPLNGTYFQVNEVFADHGSSLNPIDVPRKWIWNLPRRTVYFGTSVPAIFRGLTTEGIQHCFWRGFVCVRGFDQKTRAPRPLLARLHFPASKNIKNKKMQRKEDE